MTKIPWFFDRLVMMSSVIPSEKYSWSGSPDMLSNAEHGDRGLVRQGRRWTGGPGGADPSGQRPVRCVPLDAKRLHRLFDVLERELAQIAQCRFELSRHGIADGARDHDAARRRLGLQSGCDVHAVAVEVVSPRR